MLLSIKIQLRIFGKSDLSSSQSQMKKKKKIQTPIKAVRTVRKPIRSKAIPLDTDTQRKSRAKPNSHYEEEEDIRPTTSISSTFLEKFPILSPDFYQIDALDLAPRLLGKYLKNDDVVLQITEVIVRFI